MNDVDVHWEGQHLDGNREKALTQLNLFSVKETAKKHYNVFHI